ncbi:MAG TPA: ElyC/SanA/YdcF family protein [Bellilinea sp.]|nr:ElyC/SanA/YdcF family protein [Bellilinea sp.]
MADKVHKEKIVLRRLGWLSLIIMIIGVGIPIGINLYAKFHLYSPANAPHADVAIVFGAGLTRSGQPMPILKDRVETAVDLYNAGKVKVLLMSGDNSYLDYNEPGAMADYAMSLGVPEEKIVLDYAGRRTYDTCFRAIHIFSVKSALLVTQSYHQPRAIFICRLLGLDSAGVDADKRDYNPRTMSFWKMREIPAQWLAFWQVFVSHPLPILGNQEPIIVD